VAILDIRDAVCRMCERGASDLLLTVGTPAQYRINGELQPDGPALTPSDTLQIAKTLVRGDQMERLERDRSLDMASFVADVARFRVNLYYQRGSLALALRLIPFTVPAFEALGIPPIARDFATRPHGLVLITGPAGSGKSTTLAAMIDHINHGQRKHVVCIEDPIEYVHSHGTCVIDQREVGADAHSFAEALRSVFRQSPDVIMVGELRDLETIQLALTLAETGHLILGTLHTQDTTHAVSRIVDAYPTDQQQQVYTQLALALVGVIAQILVPSIEGHTRVLACEVLSVDSGVANLIREKQTQQIYSAIQTGRSKGMYTMNDALEELYRGRRISRDMAIRFSPRPAEISRVLRGVEK